jgi:hypothetical protein
LQNKSNSFAKGGDGKIRLLAQRLAIPVIDEKGAAASRLRAIDVAPAIADEEAALQVEVVNGSGAQQHAGLWFPAITRITMARPGVITDFDVVDARNVFAQLGVHCFDGFAALRSAAYVRLVGDDDQKKSGFLQLPAAFDGVGIKLELAEVRRRKGETIANYRAIENAVAIEKDGPLFYFVLSHFVCAVFSAG